MATWGELIAALPLRDRKGSRLRCLRLTHGPKREVAERLCELVNPYAQVDWRHDHWMPEGPAHRQEAKLGETPCFLHAEDREAITDWWLAVRKRANTPNWDIVSTASINGRAGLVLLEAKAHSRELSTRGKHVPSGRNGRRNHSRIGLAMCEASDALSGISPGWNLTCETHYQLRNRFAWAWKLASLGIPVVLVYLGFLNARDMQDNGNPFVDHAAWESAVVKHSSGTVPEHIWDGSSIIINRTPLRAIIRSRDVQCA